MFLKQHKIPVWQTTSPGFLLLRHHPLQEQAQNHLLFQKGRQNHKKDESITSLLPTQQHGLPQNVLKAVINCVPQQDVVNQKTSKHFFIQYK